MKYFSRTICILNTLRVSTCIPIFNKATQLFQTVRFLLNLYKGGILLLSRLSLVFIPS